MRRLYTSTTLRRNKDGRQAQGSRILETEACIPGYQAIFVDMFSASFSGYMGLVATDPEVSIGLAGTKRCLSEAVLQWTA